MMNEILEKVKSHFGVVDVPYYGPTYILPDGSLLNLLGKGHHSVVEHYLIDEGISNNKYIETGGSPTIETLGCIRCDMIKYYIGLSEEQPTREQYNSLLIWLDQHSRLTKIITIFGPNGEPSTNYRFTSDFISDDIVDRIRRYYISGKLYEQLDKSKDIKRQQNFTYKREMLGESLKEGDIIKLKENINWDKVQWGVHQFSTNSIIFRGTEEECAKYIDDRPELWDDAEVYFMTPDDPHYIKDQNEQDLEEDINSDKFYKNAFKQLLKLSMNLRTGPLGIDRTYYDEYGFELESQVSTFSVEFDPDSSEWTVYKGSRKKRGKGWESLIRTITDLSFTTWFGALTEEDIDYLISLNSTNSKESIQSINQRQDLEEDTEEKNYQITVKYHNEPNAKIEVRSAKDRKDLKYQLNMDDEVEWYDLNEEQFNKSLAENAEKWNIGSDKSNLTSEEMSLLDELAQKLESSSVNGYKYVVQYTYEDFGAGMQWYTIVCYDKKGDRWQVLNTKEWLQLMNTGDIDAVYSEIVSGEYFKDKRESLGEPLKQAQDQKLKEDLKINKEHLKIYFNLKIDNTNSDYSDIDDDDKRNVTREGIIEFTRYKLDVADWVDSYDYDWDSDSATVEIWVDPDTKLTKEEINNKVKEWENWYYYDTITQYGEKHDHYYYEEPWYDENEADATLSFEGYEWVPDEEK